MRTPPAPPAGTQETIDAAQDAPQDVALDAAAAAPPVPEVRTHIETDNGVHSLFFRSEGHSDSIITTDAMFMLIFWFSAFFFVLLMFLMVYWTIKYRRRPGVAPPRSPAHNTPLEVFWTVVPSSSMLVMFILGFWTYMDKLVAVGGAIELNVKAWKWDWQLTYPTGETSKELVSLGARHDIKIHALPEDTDVNLRMSSRDVIHSFWIPDYRVKMDVFPNRYTGYTFRTPTLGPGDDHPEGRYRDHWVFCAEYCGDLHSEMAAVLRVMPQEDYEAWLKGQGSSGDPVIDGKVVWQTACSACHSVDGTDNVGPTWLDLYGTERSFTDGTTGTADANYIRESILNPAAKIVAGRQNQMNSFQGVLSDDDIENVIAYMKSISQAAGEGEGADDPAPGSPDEAGEQG